MRHLLSLAAAVLLSACAQQGPVKLYSGTEQPAGQVVVVEIPETLEVLNINGQPAPAANRMIGNRPRQLHLQPGEYRINAYYQNVYDVDGGLSHEVVRTNSATFHVNGQAGEQWRLGYAEPRNLPEAQALKSDFSGWSENTRTGQRIATEAGPAYASLLTQLLGGGTVVAAGSDNGVAPLGSQTQQSAAPSAVAAPVSSSAVAEQTLPHNDATFTTLQQIWLLLGPESRKAFLEWAEQ